MKTGQQLQKLRHSANITQYELAEKLFVSRDLIAKWEAGTRRPDYKFVVMMAEIFDVPADEIISPDELLIAELEECIPKNTDADTEQIKKAVNSFLRLLPAKESSIFIRRYYLMEEPSDIADFFELKTQNIYLILSRLRKKLKKYLSEVII